MKRCIYCKRVIWGKPGDIYYLLDLDTMEPITGKNKRRYCCKKCKKETERQLKQHR